jgi:translocation and assembly module TamB
LRRLCAYVLIWLLVGMGPLMAQDEESGGMLVDFLQDTLSGDSRYIKVSGLEGALSSQATIRQITVSDDEGVWLTINGAVLDWNRLALLKGRFSVNALSAKEIIVARPPAPVETEVALPSPEAQPFQLPEFPVEIMLDKIAVERFELGKPVLGIAAQLDMAGSLALVGGALDTNLKIQRLDRPSDRIALVARFENETSLITLDLSVNEDQGGLIATALRIPDTPPLLLTAKGTGPVGDFTADINLSTSGVKRLAGQVRLQEATAPDTSNDTAPDSAPGIAFNADLGGNISSLLTPDYQPFFGADTKLSLAGERQGDGRFEIDRFFVSSDALTMRGALSVAAEGNVEAVLMNGQITPPGGKSVVLPLTGARTVISGASMSVTLDSAVSNKWVVDLGIDGLSRPDMSVGTARIKADGTLDQGDLTQIRGQFTARLDGVDFSDASLDQAVGPVVSMAGEFALLGDGALELSKVDLRGADYTAALQGRLSGLDSGFEMEGSARVGAADLSRFSGLAGRPLGGAINATLSGNGAPLGGQFAIRLDARAQDLTSGIDQIDPLIGGQTVLSLDAARDATGLKINSFALEGQALSAQASGTVSSVGSDLTFKANLDDIARVLPETSGPLDLKGKVSQGKDGVVSGVVNLKGSQTSFADLTGTLEPDGSVKLSYKAELDRIERFVPEMNGAVTSEGSAQRSGSVWRIDGDAKASAGFSAQIGGTWDEETGLSDLRANGDIQLAVANRLLKPRSIVGRASFDLALKGKPELAGVSGTITTKDAKFVLPGLAQTIEGINTNISLKDGRASLAVTASLAAGGTFRVSGPVTLTPPYQGTITTQLQQIILTDNVSYTSVADGQLVFSGPLAGNANLSGQINFGETEINLDTASGSIGAAPIPQITHLGETGAVHATRARAGLVKTDDGSSGPVIGLDIILSAPNRVFARGRGVQAELGGQIQVRGTTAQVVPAGQIELIRGNMSLLGRSLKLTRGLVSLQGKLEPYLEFAATSTTSEGTATIEISGPLGGPKIEVFSNPERPSEEALAMLIFGNRFAEMSPLAIAQMAASLAELSGKGGGLTGKARKGLGVDELSVGADEDGNAKAGAGFYVMDNLYTDFSVNADGDTELNLNLDVSERVTVKGKVDNKGATALGLFFEKDY